MKANTDKLRLLDQIRADHAFLTRTVAGLTDAQLVEPGANDDWTVKDMLAHVVTWERRFLRSVAQAERGEEPDWPEPGYTFDDLDRLNADDVAANRDRPLAEVLADFHRSFAEIVAWTAAQSDEVLFKPGHYPFTREHPLYLFLAANTYEHYPEHTIQIRLWQGALDDTGG